MSLLYALDPGTLQSALVVYDGTRVLEHVTALNGVILDKLRFAPETGTRTLVVEQIESFGMAVGQETFATVWWAGRFYEAWPNAERYQLPRLPIKIHLCNSARATDANIRAALLDKFGGSAAIGKKATPGPLYGLKGHEFAALAVAVTWLEIQAQPVAARTGSAHHI